MTLQERLADARRATSAVTHQRTLHWLRQWRLLAEDLNTENEALNAALRTSHEQHASDVKGLSRLGCSTCRKPVSSAFLPVPTDTPDEGLVVRAFIQCPECIEQAAARLEKMQADNAGEVDQSVDPADLERLGECLGRWEEQR